MNIECLKFSKLKNDQRKAFFSYQSLFKEEELKLDLLAKVIASMANAVGGEVFIGIDIYKAKFNGFGNKPNNFPSNKILTELIQTQISPQLNQIIIEDLESALYVKVLESNTKPHMLPNYKYYKRILSKNQLLEEFEIRQLYRASLKSDLQIISLSNLQGIPSMSGGLYQAMKFYPRVHIQNVGQRLEKDYKLKIAIPSFLVDPSFTLLHKYLLGYEKDTNIYSIPSTEPLYQDESKIMLELVLKLDADNYSKFLDAKIKIMLYSSEKLEEQTYMCKEWLHYKGDLPSIEKFTQRIGIV